VFKLNLGIIFEKDFEPVVQTFVDQMITGNYSTKLMIDKINFVND